MLPLGHCVEPEKTPFLKISTNKPFGQRPATLMGMVLNTCPFEGTVMVAPWVGGLPGTVASTPTVPDCCWVTAKAEGATNAVSAAAIKDRRIIKSGDQKSVV